MLVDVAHKVIVAAPLGKVGSKSAAPLAPSGIMDVHEHPSVVSASTTVNSTAAFDSLTSAGKAGGSWPLASPLCR